MMTVVVMIMMMRIKIFVGKNRKGIKNVSNRGTVTEEWSRDGRVL